MLKIFLIISFKPRNIVKENSEYLMNITFVEMKFEKINKLFNEHVLNTT
jgi:hypothetical protein